MVSTDAGSTEWYASFPINQHGKDAIYQFLKAHQTRLSDNWKWQLTEAKQTL